MGAKSRDKNFEAHQRDKELQQTVKQAKIDVDKLVSETRARLSQEITALREEELPQLRGSLDKDAHQVSTLRNRLNTSSINSPSGPRPSKKRKPIKRRRRRWIGTGSRGCLNVRRRIDSMNGTVTAVTKKLGEKLDEQDKGMTAYDAKVQQLESQNRSLTEQMTLYNRLFADYKKALTSLGEKVVQEEQRTMELSNKISGRADQLASKVDTDTRATTTYLNDVNKNVGLIAKAVENMNAQLVPRVEDQDRRLDELTKMMHGMDAQVNAAKSGCRAIESVS